VRLGAPERDEPVRLLINISGDPRDEFLKYLRQWIRPPHPPAPVTSDEEPRWVLVKGWHDQGGIEGVYGLYSEEEADWILSALLDLSSYNWTKARVQAGPAK
jgi:hypothetical protein